MEAKRHGRQANSDDEVASDEDAAEADPYFKHVDSAFDDPFFQVSDAARNIALIGGPLTPGHAHSLLVESFATERTPLQDPAEGGGDGAAASKPSKAAGLGGKQASARAAGRQAKKAQEAADRQRRAELELLLMDDSALQDTSKLGEHQLPAER